MTTWIEPTVTLSVEFAFDNPPLTATASCTWVDVSAHVRNVQIQRGRTTELSAYAPGTATLTLDNRARLFDPSNTAGTYYGKLLPMKRVRVVAAIGATTATIFAGYVSGWPIEYPGVTDSTVRVECVDAFRVLQADMPSSAFEGAVLDSGVDWYWPMQSIDAEGVVPARVGGIDLLSGVITTTADMFEATTSTLPVGATAAMGTGIGGNAVPAGTAIPKAFGWWAVGGADADLTYRIATSTTEYFGLISGGVTYSAAAVGTTTGLQSYRTGAPVDDPEFVVAIVNGTASIDVYVNGALAKAVTLTAGTSVQAFGGFTPGVAINANSAFPGGAMSHVMAWNTAPSAATIAALYQAGLSAFGPPTECSGARIGRILDSIDFPAADRDISTGLPVGQWLPAGASALSGAIECETAEQGLFFAAGDGDITFRDRQWTLSNTRATTAQIAFDDNGTGVAYRDISIDGNAINFIRNSITVTAASTITVADSTSVTAYGKQPESISATALPATSAAWLARQLAAFRLRARKDPAIRVPRITVQPRKNVATYLPLIIQLELGDRVSVTRRPTGGTGTITAQCAVQGISHQINGEDWLTTLSLSPAPKSYSEAAYLTMGDSTYGKIGATAGNIVPY